MEPAPSVEPPIDPPASAPTSGPGARTWVASGVVAAVIAVGAIVGIGAASDDGGATVSSDTAASADSGTGASGAVSADDIPEGAMRRMGSGGTITAIDGATITVDGVDGTEATIETNDDTVVTESVDAAVSDLGVGDQVRVMGDGSETEVAARQIVVGDVEIGGPMMGVPGGAPPSGDQMTPPEGMELPEGAELPEGERPDGAPIGGPMGGAIGEITAIDGDTITVTSEDGTAVTVTVSDETTVSRMVEIEVADLVVGDEISARGDTADDGTVTAASITKGAMFLRGGPPR